MSRSSKSRRRGRSIDKRDLSRSVSRTEDASSISKYSRFSDSSGYGKQRRQRARRKRIFTIVITTLLVLVIGAGAAIAGIMIYMNSVLQSDLDLDAIAAATVDRGAPEDPFWILLVGTDDRVEGEAPRSDTIILARIDPGHKTAALISIPRDSLVTLPGYGQMKINAAYHYGVLAEDEGHSGPEFAINAVSELTGVGISGYAQVDFSGFKTVVDSLGGVEVEVPMDIYDFDTGALVITAGTQRLNGDQALIFCRSRDFQIGDYQRQANQRTFLQALAKQILASDPLTIANTVTQICQMTQTNLNIAEIVSIASSMRGMQESDIYTYSIPAYSDMIGGVSYEIPDVQATRSLMAQIEAGEFPDPEDVGLTRQGETPDDYKPNTTPETADQGGQLSAADASAYVVAVRNGYGIAGSATSVSDMLALAGYQQGEIGNANSYVYKETLIVYRDDSDRAAADDIRSRLGFGRVIPSLGRYVFEGNVLVVVGGDFSA